MNKQTKLLIGLGVLGAAAYYLWLRNNNKNQVAENQSNTDMPLSRGSAPDNGYVYERVSPMFDFGRDANSPSDCKSDETFVEINCITYPCPSMCVKNTQSFTGSDNFFKTHSQNCSGLNCA